jgi:monothiol glutaredoxin
MSSPETNTETLRQIDEIVKSAPVVLFMKGSKSFPQCGFSSTCVQILNRLLPDYKTVNVLADPAVRQGIKDYSNWPTIPQLYVKGEFVGGSDIVKEMYGSGELAKKLGVVEKPVEKPAITITPAAAKVLGEALGEAGPGDVVHMQVDDRYEHALALGPREPGAIEVAAGGLTVWLDADSAARARGVTIDYVDGPGGGGFKIENPNAPAKVVALSPAELKDKLAAGGVRLYDVRTPAEREIAAIAGSTLLDDAAMKAIGALPKDTPLAFYCHTGMRSASAAEHFRGQGFTAVFNLAGGINAWAQAIDPSMKRY